MSDIFDELNVPKERRTEDYRELLTNGDHGKFRDKCSGLWYGATYYQGNEKWLQKYFDPLPYYLKELYRQMADELFDDE